MPSLNWSKGSKRKSWDSRFENAKTTFIRMENEVYPGSCLIKMTDDIFLAQILWPLIASLSVGQSYKDFYVR
jgi:hypothetical protein